MDGQPHFLHEAHGHQTGSTLWRGRSRWDGVLNADELAWCRANGVALAYDPVQIGWVPLESAESRSVPVTPTSSPQVSLRPWRDRDAPLLARYLSAKALWTYLPETYAGAMDVSAARDLIQICNEADHHLVRAIVSDGVAVGQVRLLFEGKPNQAPEAEISYWIGTEHQGRGIASIAVQEATRTAFEANAALTRILARIHADNTSSQTVVTKAGYRRISSDATDRMFLHFQIER